MASDLRNLHTWLEDTHRRLLSMTLKPPENDAEKEKCLAEHQVRSFHCFIFDVGYMACKTFVQSFRKCTGGMTYKSPENDKLRERKMSGWMLRYVVFNEHLMLSSLIYVWCRANGTRPAEPSYKDPRKHTDWQRILEPSDSDDENKNGLAKHQMQCFQLLYFCVVWKVLHYC